MMGNKQIPHRDDLRSYDHAVAGHDGTLCDADGELFVKPCTKTEIDFYHSANRRHPEFADLMPLFYGTLQLSDPAEVKDDDNVTGIVDDAGAVLPVKDNVEAIVSNMVAAATSRPPQEDNIKWVPNKSKKIKTETAVVLENASHGFKHPNILDAKLGVRLWADDAPLEKKRRFDKITSETTHGKLGFRIAGMRVYHGSEISSELNEEGYRIYDKDYGRTTVNDDNVVDAFRKFVFNPAAGIDKELGAAVCAAFVADLERVEAILSRHESRMYSSSLLFIMEGDGPTLRRAIEESNAVVEAINTREKSPRTAKRVDSGIALEEEEDDQVADSGSDYDDSELSSLPKIYRLKLIDFAHAEWTPGQGPDENTLIGVRSLKRIFEEMAQ